MISVPLLIKVMLENSLTRPIYVEMEVANLAKNTARTNYQ